MNTTENNEWIKSYDIMGFGLENLVSDIFEDNDSELVEYYIETICGEDMYEYMNDVRLYDKKKVDAFRWAGEWLIEYMMTNDGLPERTGSKYSTDDNFIASLIVGYEDECDELKSAMIQMNRNRLLDELLA
jgi:hypothetical protein